jgi:bifunctional non-homologous end joining protein LigD
MKPVEPMLATLVQEPFDRAGWVYEEKYDGDRTLAYRARGRVRLVSRGLKDVTGSFAEVARALEALPGGDFALDGEVVVFDGKGVSRFQLLQRRALGEHLAPVFVVFDCLERDGVRLIHRPLRERREALEAIVPEDAGIIRRSRRIPTDGIAAFRTAKERGWEGIVAKDEASPYEPARRSKSWLKVKSRRQSELVIGGFTEPRGQRAHFGALLVGLYDGPPLRFTGKVGTGFTRATLDDLERRMRPLATDRCPFGSPPGEKAATWVKPRLVAEIAFAEWTDDGKLRHPVFLGLRDDKDPRECTWAERER